MNIIDIVVKLEYFPRLALNEDTIARYKELYELGEPLPPLVVQKEKLILIDGFHRLEALKRLGRTTVEVILMDIPEEKIFPTNIRLNNDHGLPPSKEDRYHQIRILRFKTKPPWTYVQIADLVKMSVSRVGEICRAQQEKFKINGTINTKVDLRSDLTEEDEEEIQERLDKGESTSEVAKDYPVSESRVSQLKKKPRVKKVPRVKKASREYKPRKMPRSWMLRNLKKRVDANNPYHRINKIDWDELDSSLEYMEAVTDLSGKYPDIEWFYPKERGGLFYDQKIMPLEIHEKSVTIRLRLCWTNKAKYAQVKGTIPKKVLDYVRDKLYEEWQVEWPLTESMLDQKAILDVYAKSQDKRVFPELSDEELSEMAEKGSPSEDEDLEDEEMKKWKDSLPE